MKNLVIGAVIVGSFGLVGCQKQAQPLTPESTMSADEAMIMDQQVETLKQVEQAESTSAAVDAVLLETDKVLEEANIDDFSTADLSDKEIGL